MRIRLILSFVTIVFVSVGIVVLIARQGAVSEVNAFMARGGMVRLDTLVSDLEAYYQAQGSWEGAQTLLQESGMHGNMGGRGAGQGNQGGMAGMLSQGLLLADADGVVVARSGEDLQTEKLSPAEISRALPLKSGWRTVGYLLPVGSATLTSSDQRFLIERLSNAALIGGLVAGGLALLLGLVLAARLIRPVQMVTSAANRLAQGDLTQRVPVIGRDEFADLAHSFNQMADSLQRAQDSRRAMTADIAHELRTPLAVQRANLEAMQDGVYPLNAESLAQVLEQNQLLARLVEDLRTLALADAGQLTLERAETDLPALLQGMAERFRPQASANQVTIEVILPGPCPTAWLDPTRIEQVLVNLLSNALRYTPQSGCIRLSLVCQGEAAEITVHDSGPGIPPESLGLVFDRFYRIDRARSRQDGGSGLGLAIARQLVQAHGGELSAENHPQGGALFRIKLPLGSPTR